MYIRQNEVLKVVNNIKNLRLGRKYLSYHDYESVKIDRDMRSLDYNIVFKYDISGYESIVKLILNEAGAITNYNCTCNYCNKESGCAHVALAVFQLANIEVTDFPYYHENIDIEYISAHETYMENIKRFNQERQLMYNLNKSEELIEFAKKSMINKLMAQDNQSKYRLFFELIFDSNNIVKIRVKVGSDKLYVVKNFNNFITQFKTNEKQRYGKNLVLVHNENSFDEESVSILNYIKTNLGENINNDSYNILSGENVDEIYDLTSLLDKEHTNITCDESDDKIHVKVEEVIKGYYTFSLVLDKQYFSSNNYVYYVSPERNSITRLDISPMSTSAILMNEIIENDSIIIKKNNLDNFYDCFFNNSDIFVIDKFVDSENEKLVENESTFKVYADLNENFDIRLTIVCNVNNEIKLGFDHDFKTYNLEIIEQFVHEYTDDVNYDDHYAIIKASSDSAFYFVSDGISTLQQFCEVYVSDDLKRFAVKPKYDLSVGVKVNNNLLEVDIKSMDLPSKEVIEMIRQLRRKKKFFRLKNGDVINIQSDEIKELDALLTDMNINLNEFKDDKAKLGLYRTFEMNQKSDESANISIIRDTYFKEFVSNFKDKVNTELILNPKYVEILRDYQKEGVAWLNLIKSYGFGCILADDMGLGKTLQIIALLDSSERVGNSIVVTPASLILNWESEILKFTDSLNYVNVTGTSKHRAEIIANLKGDEFIITSYDYLRKDYELYENVEFEWIILDEAQYIKNPRTQNAISVKSLNGKHKIALTGTPIENALSELWSIFDFLMPNYLYNYNYFKNHFEKDIVMEQDMDKQNKLKKMIEPFMLRRNKKEVLKELPDKIEHVMEYEFSPEEKDLYLGHLAMVNDELSEAVNTSKADKFLILAMLTKLRQICCEPRVLFEDIKVNSSKMNGCLDIIENLRDNNQKVLLFSSFTSVLSLIEEELKKRNISYYKLTGSTDKVERFKLVEKFQNDATSVFLISLKSGGTGLNLTSAQAVIHFDPWWNVSAQNQATDRAYRIGQNKNVQVFKLVMKDSIEKKIITMQERKKNLADAFVEGNDGRINSMSIDDMIDLFKVD